MAKDYYRFPTLERTRAQGRAHQFILCQENSKLYLVSDVSEGDLAFCCDTEKLYIRKETAWAEVGGGEGGPATWGDIEGTLADQTDLQSALNGKASTSHGHSIADTTGLQTALDGKAASSHTHTIANVTSLQATLDGKAASSHGHAIGDVTNLQSTLDGKASTSHGHGISDVTGLQAELDGKINAPLTDGELGSGTPNSSNFLRGDRTWAAPTASVAAPFMGAQAPGSFTVSDGQFGIQGKRLALTSNQRGTMQGSGRLILIG
jgi:hypothetical protein